MQAVVICSEEQKKALTIGMQESSEIIYVQQIEEGDQYPNADAFVDLLFQNTAERTERLKRFLPKTVIIHSVEDTLTQIDPAFVRINAWRTFLESTIIEGSTGNEAAKKVTEQVFSSLGKKLEWVPDEPGLVTARVISMIINEAYFTLSEKVSTKEEIDVAMKLGTNYPYGPFEWSTRIGLKSVADLLNKLSSKNKRYTPCPLLIEEAGK